MAGLSRRLAAADWLRGRPPIRAAGRVRRPLVFAYRRATSARRGLPSYLIIGAQRAGTTSLHDYIGAHPDVKPPWAKEVHYFSLHATRPLAWYRSHFPASGAMTGEATPYYLFHPLAPAHVAQVLPDVKLIVLLRNPITRAHSHHTHERLSGTEPLEFAEALEREQERTDGEEERLMRNPGARSFAHQHYSYLARGAYAHQLERWLRHFPRERLLLLATDDLSADPDGSILRVEAFLGLEPHVPDDLPVRHKNAYDPIDEELRERLRAHFEPQNQALYRLLGRDLGWS